MKIYGVTINHHTDRDLERALRNPSLLSGAKLEIYFRGLFNEPYDAPYLGTWALKTYKAGKIKHDYIIANTPSYEIEQVLYNEIKLTQIPDAITVWRRRVQGKFNRSQS